MDATQDPNTRLYAALARAQAKFKPIAKNREVQITMKSGGKFKFRYADIDQINLSTREALTSEGLSLVQPVKSDPATNAHWIETMLLHADGGVLSSRIDVKPPTAFGDPKEFGAAVTYLRRYAVTSLLGLAADDDLDANGQPAGESGDSAADEETARRVNALTEGLIAEVKKRDTDEGALNFWRKEKEQLKAYPNAYEEFKNATTAHRRALAAQRQPAGAQQ